MTVAELVAREREEIENTVRNPQLCYECGDPLPFRAHGFCLNCHDELYSIGKPQLPNKP